MFQQVYVLPCIFTYQRKHFIVSFECAVALLYSVDARLRLDLVGIEGPEGHREPLVPVGLS